MRMRGFSLLEMLLVMALIAAASLLAVSAFGGGLPGMQLRAGAKELAAQLRFARVVAVSSGIAQDVVLDPKARRWEGAKGRSGNLPEVGEVVFTGASSAQFGQQGNREEAAANTGVIRFFPDGASTGGRIRLTRNGGGWDVDVRWLTGEVQVVRVRGEAR